MACQELRRTDIQRVVDAAPTSGKGARVRRVLGTALRRYEDACCRIRGSSRPEACFGISSPTPWWR